MKFAKKRFHGLASAPLQYTCGGSTYIINILIIIMSMSNRSNQSDKKVESLVGWGTERNKETH